MRKVIAIFFILFIACALFSGVTKSYAATASIPDSQTFQNQFPDYYNYIANVFGFPTGNTTGGLPVACLTPVQTANGSDPTPDDYRNALKKNFGLITYELPQSFTLDQLQQTYDTACILYGSTMFRHLIKTIDDNGKLLTPISVTILPPTVPYYNPVTEKTTLINNDCGTGHAQPILTVGWCPRETFGDRSVYMNRFLLTHELAHNLEYRNPQLRSLFEGSGLYSQTTPSKDLPTYNCQHDYDSATQHGPYEDECFADMVGEFPVYNNFFHFDTSKVFSDYVTTYKQWYDFASTNIFGGTSFQNSTLPLPNPIPFPISSSTKDQELNTIFSILNDDKTNHNSFLVNTYKQASSITGIPWMVLAAVHYREGGMLETTSLVSGRPIGHDEPDIDRAGGCSSNTTPGKPKPLPGGGCGFTNLLDTAIYAGNLLKVKNNNAVPKNFQELVRALSGYNGYGNQDCGQGANLYKGCPPVYPSEDSPYALNFFDQKHAVMQRMYCSDGTLCQGAVEDPQIGTATTFVELYRKGYR